MEITRQADYAVRAVLDLALRSAGERAFSEDIASRQNVPPAFLTKILARLAAEGIVDTHRGVKGGIRLARPATEITLLQVVEAIDGPITLNRCAKRPQECPRDSTCVVHPIWIALRDDLRARMTAITFDTLARSARANPVSAPLGSAIRLEDIPIARLQA
jgi:Rrf2 family protein